MRKSNVFLCGLLIAAVVVGLSPANLSAANKYWDTDPATGLQAGNGIWDTNTSAYWSTSTSGSNPLVKWTSTADYAYLQAVGTSNITLSGITAERTFIYCPSSATADNVWNLSGTLTSTNRLQISAYNSTRTNTVNFSSGTITTGYFTLGEGYLYAGTHIFNMTGGLLNLPNTANGLAIGLQGGKGYLNVSGGTIVETPSTTINCVVGSRGGANYADVEGYMTISGTGVVKLENAAFALQLGRNDTTGASYTSKGFLNLEAGGTLWTSRSITQTNGQADKTFGTFYFNGGTLKALDGNQSNWIGHSNPNFQAFIKAGGALIDTYGYDMTITQALLTDAVSTGGGLTKLGTGTLTLTGLNTYTGDTKVEAGTLSLAQDYLADTSAVWIADGALLNLSHGLVDTVGALYLGGVAQGPGTYHAGNCSYITGTGSLHIVPEPSALALLACGLIGLLAYAWRKRK
jgi:autotransporter-associated beta strand protein